MRQRGTVDEWNDDRGFGFIAPEVPGARIFVHITAFPAERRPAVGDAVSYVEHPDAQNRPRASHVRYVEPARPARAPRGLRAALVVVGVFLGWLVSLVVLGHANPLLPVPTVVLSAVSFELYRADKSAAQRNAWRVSESMLHAVAVLGGWPGALVASRWFRHKTTKQPFVSIFWATVLANVAILTWLAVGPSSPLG
ncbi:cold shock and DUF1294 domain-containing protein [Phycicoccus sp.]|uniref:cold shock and DUF1294 domain-containing protein n=1 Tax=Phycicoccus sp. TaxID=1902410 RepID=UPI002C35A091|nr:cold shock and DUF1294 domain-containing protein [Phycicoccus sp.]HMM96637.1 cold shock and DUF1294 domain-containing protein [Phycicoccus sp.]